jgi:hypothetical protein
MKQQRSLVFHKELNNSWKNKVYIEARTQKAKKSTEWGKNGHLETVRS